jgi:hypothetical protein
MASPSVTGTPTNLDSPNGTTNPVDFSITTTETFIVVTLQDVGSLTPTTVTWEPGGTDATALTVQQFSGLTNSIIAYGTIPSAKAGTLRVSMPAANWVSGRLFNVADVNSVGTILTGTTALGDNTLTPFSASTENLIIAITGRGGSTLTGYSAIGGATSHGTFLSTGGDMTFNVSQQNTSSIGISTTLSAALAFGGIELIGGGSTTTLTADIDIPLTTKMTFEY